MHVASCNEVTNALVGLSSAGTESYRNAEMQESAYEGFGISVQDSGLSETYAQQEHEQPPVRFSYTDTDRKSVV